MLAKKCDRCGKLYEDYRKAIKTAKGHPYEKYQKVNGIVLCDFDSNGDRTAWKYMEFCPGRLDKLSYFLTDISEETE